jgi:Protein of unknown function (DUF2510)
MTAVILVIVVGTAIWVGFDAGGRDWTDDRFANRPWKWVLGCLLLWIVIFPMYLVRRNRTGTSSGLPHGSVTPPIRNGPVFWWGISSCAAMAIGAIGPWATVLGMSVRGVDGNLDGWLILGLAAVGLLATVTGPRLALLSLLTGIAGVGITLYDRHNIDSAISHAGALGAAVASVGWGLDLALIASASLAIQAAISGTRSQSAGATIGSTAPATGTVLAASASAVALAPTGQTVSYRTSNPAAGWYPDPYDELRLRYWTGDEWSNQTAEVNSGG